MPRDGSITTEFTHFHFCCGIGGAAKGFNAANPRVGGLKARFRCLGGVDVSPSAVRDFTRLVGVPGTVMDLFTRDQYTAFHGSEPPPGWREMTPADIRRAAGNERPNIVFISSPCKGASGLLSEARSRTPKYQALNELTLRCIWLMAEAWADDPVDLIVFENVPRLASRGRHLLDQINQVLQSYGYAVAETTHDCGELGGLAQSRKRFLLVARHTEKVPPFLYEPEKKRLRAVGDILGRMPLPGDPAAGPMHRLPRLQFKTWVRLAFVEAGSDWRSLNRLAVENGHLRDYLLVPEMRRGTLGVNGWGQSTGTVTTRGLPMNGNFSVADPRFEQSAKWRDGQAYGVRGWDETSGTITSQQSPGQGCFAVADPRPSSADLQGNVYRIVRRGEPDTGRAIADPRSGLNMRRHHGDAYLTGGHYGVVSWDSPSGAVSAAAGHDNGRWSVADPRPLPAPDQKTVAIIRALDGTFHRPFSTLELAALQSLIEPEEYLLLDGCNDSVWREHVGNLVPPHAATAIAEVMGTTLLLADSGETFVLSATPIWVRNVALALTMPGEGGV
ncbi:DNA cytosine methyltransferase (plasmid) [Massilia varians]|uniref:DNA cytosine methyltransferase n=1 Tax=Massilia sp. X63 TaxID=3237285 RepID=UPI0034DD0933